MLLRFIYIYELNQHITFIIESRRHIMQQDTNILKIPGPSPIPPSVQHAMNQPMIGHLVHETSLIVNNIKLKLKVEFVNKKDVVMVNNSQISDFRVTAF